MCVGFRVGSASMSVQQVNKPGNVISVNLFLANVSYFLPFVSFPCVLNCARRLMDFRIRLPKVSRNVLRNHNVSKSYCDVYKIMFLLTAGLVRVDVRINLLFHNADCSTTQFKPASGEYQCPCEWRQDVAFITDELSLSPFTLCLSLFEAWTLICWKLRWV